MAIHRSYFRPCASAGPTIGFVAKISNGRSRDKPTKPGLVAASVSEWNFSMSLRAVSPSGRLIVTILFFVSAHILYAADAPAPAVAKAAAQSTLVTAIPP